MPALQAPPSTLPPNATPEMRQELMESIWRGWQPGASLPRWEDFLPPSGELCTPELVFVLLQMDVEFRVKAGVGALLAEGYFQHERLQAGDARLDAGRQQQLIRWEYQQRWQRGERAARRPYLERFPEHAAALHDLSPRWNCPRCKAKALKLEEAAESADCPHCRAQVPLTELFPPLRDSRGLDLREYQLLDSLGRGGMGEVYLSRDPGLDRLLALKVLRADLHGQRELERRFEEEARITGSLQHPNIVPVHNIGRLRDGRLYFTMKVVRGSTFADLLAEQGGEEHQAAHLGIFEQVCQAVAYAHSKGVIHRDLKPENVMVGRFGEVQVMDWGLAKVLGKSLDARQEKPAGLSEVATRRTEGPGALTYGALGTRAYMAPEQANGEWDRADERVDVFGLGGILCALLTGQPPYRGSSDGEVFRKAQRGDLTETFVRLDGSGADPVLVGLAKECLGAEMESRPRNASAVAGRVGAHLAAVQQRLRAAEVDRAAAQARAEEAVKKVAAEGRARRLLLGLVAAVLVGASGATLFAVRANEKAEEARKEATRADDEATRANNNAQAARAGTNRAEEAERTAHGQAERARRVSELLGALFESTDPVGFYPSGLRSGNLTDRTVREVLERAHVKVESRLKEDPLFGATMLDIIGDVYRSLGLYREARLLLQEALDLRRKLLPETDPNLAVSLHRLGWLLHDLGYYDEARELYEQALRLHRKHGDKQLVAMSAFHLAWLLADNREFELAGDLFKEVIALRRGGNPRDLVIALTGLAAALNAQGRTLEAISKLLEAVSLAVSLIAKHPRGEKAMTAVMLFNMGVAFREMGWSGGAKFALAWSQRITQELLGDKHAYIAFIFFEQAKTQAATRDLDGAEQLYQKCLSIARQSVGLQHPKAINAVISLAELFARSRRLDKAKELLEEVLAARRKYFGTRHQLVAEALEHYGDYEYFYGDTKQAEKLYQEAIELNPKSSSGHYRLGRLLESNDKPGDAALLYGKAIQIDPRNSEAHINLGRALLAQGLYGEAGQAARTCLNVLSFWHDRRDEVDRRRYLADLGRRLPAFLKVDARLTNASEQADLATVCSLSRRYTYAVKFAAAAFAASPALADDLAIGHRYVAACAAVLAGGGVGEDASMLDDRDRARLRGQAHTWLLADLTLWSNRFKSGRATNSDAVIHALRSWQSDSALVAVRDRDALLKLPEGERKEWRTFWADVEALQQRAENQVNGVVLLGEAEWSEYTIEAEVMPLKGTGEVGIAIHHAATNDFVAVVFGGWKNTYHGFLVFQPSGGPHLLLPLTNQPGRTGVRGKTRLNFWHQMRVEVRGKTARAFLDGHLFLETDQLPRKEGRVGLRTVSTTAKFRKIKVTDPKGKVLFEEVPERE